MKKSEGIFKTAFITFPRSGHNYLIKILRNYFNNIGQEVGYCEYYTHCKTFPCIDMNNQMMKNHDFNLDIPFDPEMNYIVQIRHPYPAIQSLFDLNQVYMEEYPNSKTFSDFLAKKVQYYKKFCEKWLSYNGVNVVKYEDLFIDQFTQSKRVINSMTGGWVDEEALSKSIKNNPVWPRSLATHPFFNLEELKKIENQLGDLLGKVGIKIIAGQIAEELPKLTANPLFEEVKAKILKGYQQANATRAKLVSLEKEFENERAKYQQIIAELKKENN